MSTIPTAFLTAVGIAFVALAIRDIFDTLLHTEARGPLARLVVAWVWRVCRLWHRRSALLVAGPLGLLVVVGLWAALLVLGWSLLLWPQLEDGFSVAGTATPGFWDALHVSLTSLTTLGFTDLIPEKDWLRVITPLEALVGFGLLSASISYLLLIYPVLARRRSLAYEVSLLREAEPRTGLLAEHLDSAGAERMYADLTSRVVVIERDLVDFPVTYYFAESDERFSFAAVAPYLLDLARRGTRFESSESVRLRAELLVGALDDFARTAAEQFPHTRAESTDSVLAAYARDHQVKAWPA